MSAARSAGRAPSSSTSRRPATSPCSTNTSTAPPPKSCRPTSSACWPAACASEEKTMPDMTTRLGAHGAHHIAPDAHGQNFYAIDRQFQDLLSLYMAPALLKQMTPHFERLGELAADRHPPVLQARDRFGRDEDWIDYHPSYREMEKIAFEEFGMHAMTHRAGVLGLAEPADPLVKYGITYLFVQAEFGLMCPVSVSDTSNFMIKRYGSPALKKMLLDRLLS